MSEAKRKILYLVVEGLPAEQRPDAGAVSVWGRVD